MIVIQFYSDIDKKRVGNSLQKFQPGPQAEIYSLTYKEQDKTRIELPLDMASISASGSRLQIAAKITLSSRTLKDPKVLHDIQTSLFH